MHIFLVRFHDDETWFLVRAHSPEEAANVFLENRKRVGFLNVMAETAEEEGATVESLVSVKHIPFGEDGVYEVFPYELEPPEARAMSPTAALELLDKIATGRLKVGTTYAWTHAHMSPQQRALLSEDGEIKAWEKYRQFAESVESKVRFSKKGVANRAERQRRRVLMGMFELIEFRSRHPTIKELFQKSVGQVSLRELMTFCGPKIPHFYYKWAFDVLPMSKKTFGPDTLKKFVYSPDHRRTFRTLDRINQDLFTARKVMES